MPGPPKSNWQHELRFLLPVCLIAFFIFANSLNGEFVYDDTRQIVRNPLIQDPTLYGTALTSDVWAFKGDRTVTMSNYWRPTFTAFHALNFQLFGLSPLGWHLFSVLLHSGICGLIFLLLRRMGGSSVPAFAVAILFAVHPVHTESVAWISGSPDLLFALCFLGSLWFAINYSERQTRFDLILSLILYALALGAKEVALFCFPIYWLVFAKKADGDDPKSPRRGYFLTAAYAALGSLYFLLRWSVLGRISQPPEEAAGLVSAMITVPSAFLFYLKQIVIPISLGPNYALRPVSAFDPLTFTLPLMVSVAACALLFLLARRSFIQKAGFLLFFLPLIPALNLSVFTPEQIVHDRYLYLPLLGFLMITLPYFGGLAEKSEPKIRSALLIAAAVLVSIPLALKAYSYNQVWKNETALWEHSVRIDDQSSFNWSQYGTALAESGDFPNALKAYDNALDIKPTPMVYLGRARTNLSLNNLEEAVWDLKTVTEIPGGEINAYTLYLTYEALAIAFGQQNKLDDAARVLKDARTRLPIYSAALTEKLAVVYYQQGKKDLALQELESAKIKARAELLPESKAVLYRLGMLYAELGRNEEAITVLTEYLRLTAPLQDRLTMEDRAQAGNMLKQLK